LRPPRRTDYKANKFCADAALAGRPVLRLRWFPRQAAPLARANSDARVARHEGDRAGLDHAELLADHAALAVAGVLDHHGPLQHRAHTNLFTAHERVETAADLVVERGDDGGEGDKLGGAAHRVLLQMAPSRGGLG
jgi:hypothetical protein